MVLFIVMSALEVVCLPKCARVNRAAKAADRLNVAVHNASPYDGTLSLYKVHEV